MLATIQSGKFIGWFSERMFNTLRDVESTDLPIWKMPDGGMVPSATPMDKGVRVQHDTADQWVWNKGWMLKIAIPEGKAIDGKGGFVSISESDAIPTLEEVAALQLEEKVDEAKALLNKRITLLKLINQT